MPPLDPHRAFAEMRALGAFRSFSDDQLAGLALIAERTSLYPAQVLFEEQDTGDDLYLLVVGDVEVVRATAVGEQVLARLRSGTLLGEASFLDGGPRAGTVVAWFESDLLRFPARELRHLCEDDPGFALALMRALWRSLADRIRQANGQMASIMVAEGVRQEAQAVEGDRLSLQPEAKLEVLREQGLGASQLDALAHTLRSEHFSPGAFIFTEGQPGRALYIVAEGRVRVSRRFPGMGEEAIAILRRGDVFGEMALIDGQPRSADARSGDEGCTVLSVNRARLDEVLRREPLAGTQFLGHLCKVLCRRLRAMNDMLVAWRTMAGFG